jgi:hypothetical protein
MMNFFGWRETTLFLTLLTYWVSLDKAVTDSFPGFIVSFIYLGVALILIVVPTH